MERIIADTYVKGEMKLWDLEPDHPNNQRFNRKITAVNNMYGWLYEQGILEKVAFEFKDYNDCTYFAFDAKELERYRGEMEACGLEDAALAASHIFDIEYTPCEYSGAIELTWTMFSYRDFDGTVGRSWECDLCKHLNACAVLDVADVKVELGVKEAVRKAFELSGFEPSHCFRVRALGEDDREQVELLDEKSGNDVAWGIDSEEYAWGVFLEKELIGYCTLGGADNDCGYEDFDEWTFDSLCLSDVFVKEEHRGKGAASALIEQALDKANSENESVFLTLLDDRLAEFYEKFGFRPDDNFSVSGIMVRNGARSLEKQINNAKGDVAKNAGREVRDDEVLR